MDLMVVLNGIIDGLMGKYEWFITVILWIGFLRTVFKPTMTWLHTIADATPTTKDNEALAKAENSKFYSIFVFALDWLASIKIKK